MGLKIYKIFFIIFIYINLSFILFFFSLIIFFLFLKFFILNIILFFEISLININSLRYSLILFFDYNSFLFIMVVLIISSIITLYRIEYILIDIFKVKFIYILILFVVSILFIIIGQNLLIILLGWDGLGLISYCLVIYYNNWSSFNSGIITLLTNRLGDVGILISIGLFRIFGDWNYLNLFFLIQGEEILLIIIILLACLTKRAQIPFSAWLPIAMAAPTPVSALVHSSTLVTAGVYLIYRVRDFLFKNKIIVFFILFLSILTIFFSGFIASFENDLKKIIALSTLSQLGLILIRLLINLKLLRFFHLIVHAIFKSLLFICAGIILHRIINNQDIRKLGVLNYKFLFTLIIFNCSNLALCGIPFISGFYSKDLILEILIFLNLNYFILLIFYLSIIFTVIYTFRLIFFMILNFIKFYRIFIISDRGLINFSMLFIFFISIIRGRILNWLIFYSLNLTFFRIIFKRLILIIILISIIIGIFLNNFNENYIYKYLYIFFNSLWILNYFISLILKKLLFFINKLFKDIEVGWGEIIGIKFLNLIFINLIKIEVLNMLLFIKIIIFFFIIIIFIYKW